jgi:hypothetical protein
MQRREPTPAANQGWGTVWPLKLPTMRKVEPCSGRGLLLGNPGEGRPAPAIAEGFSNIPPFLSGDGPCDRLGGEPFPPRHQPY